MDADLDRVFAKTEKGRQELAARSRNLSVRARAALILVNGTDGVRVLRGKLGPGAMAVIEDLLHAGLIEPRGPAQDKPPGGAIAPPATAAPGAALSDFREQLRTLQREALACLTPHFGPDVLIVAGPLLAATSFEAFADELASIERKLAIYVGKTQAARIVAALRA
ncbi:hypothetical protein WKW77_31540 [Variovorax ureilyticus]|uniref:Uncharacterized protein n=1 Tax=Variovorax ureilyticus TaxID=1836198 RepID=A0ABU8VPP9_9BURK